MSVRERKIERESVCAFVRVCKEEDLMAQHSVVC